MHTTDKSTNTAAWVSPNGPEHLICGLSEPKSQHLLYNNIFSTVHLWYSTYTRTSCRKLWPVRTRHRSMNVWSYLYRVTGQPSILRSLTWCLIAELCHVTPRLHWAMWSMQDCRTAGLSLTGCSIIAWILDLHCMVLHLQTV